MDSERVVVQLHLNSGEAVVKKVWRFDPQKVLEYTRSAVELQLIELFPDVSRKGLKFYLWYEDDLAGEVRL